MGWVVKAEPRSSYPRERPGTHCIGGWVGPRVSLNCVENLDPNGIRFPDRPARSLVTTKTTLSRPIVQIYSLVIYSNKNQ